tara:strand:- start:84 stop:368 length:285 start_codon:yes stop_codon:yes gene_type:complete
MNININELNKIKRKVNKMKKVFSYKDKVRVINSDNQIEGLFDEYSEDEKYCSIMVFKPYSEGGIKYWSKIRRVLVGDLVKIDNWTSDTYEWASE